MLAKPSTSRWGLLGPSFVPGGEKTGWESESCYDSLSAGISRLLRKGAVAHPLKKKDRSKSQKRLYNFGLLL